MGVEGIKMGSDKVWNVMLRGRSLDLGSTFIGVRLASWCREGGLTWQNFRSA